MTDRGRRVIVGAMRGMTAEVRLKKTPEEVWRWWLAPAHWDAFFGAVACVALKHSFQGEPGPGLKATAADRRGRELLEWRVTEWRPPESFAVTAAPDRRGARYRVELAVRIEDPKDGTALSSRVRVSLRLILRNAFLEALTLLLPAHWLYGLLLRRALRRVGR